MIVGPAGTGKTVLLSSWLDQASADQVGRVRWSNAQDHVPLGEVLLLAAGVPVDEARVLTGSDQSAADVAATVLDELLRRREDSTPPDLVVLDDAHLLPASQIAMLSSILKTSPDLVRLLIASRRDLPLPVFELSLHGEASTIRAGELRFTGLEAEELVRQHLDSPSEEAVRQLSERADGWAAALVLGARAVAGIDGVEAIRSVLGRAEEPIVDVLLGEVFVNLTVPVREVLLSTFEESHLTATRAEVLSGRTDAGMVLSSLAADGLLVTAYAHEDRGELVYACHPLLVELLRRRTASDDADAVIVSSAHQRAALKHAANGESSSPSATPSRGATPT